ncbi:TonB-dependent receptor [Sphingomonas jatrophae]|uniref:TonB-dependent receptor n=1 Tax=Sphingomonas jatrophae TaxID=1166337 RepID=UPI0013F4C39C|nr:TonB-dependent receptor [Sphingomonas jatrophae]
MKLSLKDVARKTGLQLLFAHDDVAGLRGNAVKGEMTGANALRQLLDRSGLHAVPTGPDSAVIRRAPRVIAMNYAQPDQPSVAPSQSAPLPAVVADEAAAAVPESEIVVTGSLIKQSSLASPIDVIGFATLAARAISNPSELVRALPGNAGSEAQVDQLNQPLTSGTAQFNLRNLGLGSTLVLVNGRRQTLSAVAAGDGSTFTDINSIMPLIALQRIDVVKDGAAATYGSDAVAGVVNFITRRRVDGAEVSGRYNFLDGARQIDLEGIVGTKLLGGDLVLAASYYGSSRLATGERSFSRASTFGRPAWHSVSSYGQPGSYFVPSLRAFRPDPNCLNAAFPDSFKTSPADTFCRYDFSEFFDLIPKERRAQVFATFNAELGDDIDLNLEAGYANTYSKTAASPSFPILAISPVVPAGHPDNPFGEDVRFRGRLLGSDYGPSIATFNYDTFRVAGGLSGPLAGTWTWSTNATYSQQLARYNKPDALLTPLTNALRGLGGPGCDPATGRPGVGACRYFNPFGSARLGTGTQNSPELINSLIGYTDLHGKTSLVTLDGLTSGELFQYGGGTVLAALGVQYRRSTFRHDWGDLVNAGELINLGQAPDFSGKQENLSIFGELKVPAGERVEVQLSGRYEKYLDSFGNFSPKVAVLARPFDELSVRASWGKAFRAPSVYQLVAVQSAQPSVNDGGAFVFANTQTFGNPDLRPEKSTNYNLGATLRPVRGLELSADFFSFDYKDLIVKENPQPIIDQAIADTLAGRTGTPAQQRVTRDISGGLQGVRLNFINASSVKTQGLDVSGRYTVETDIGTVEASAAWTHFSKYSIQLAAGAAPISGLGSVNFNNLGRSLPQDRVEYGTSFATGAHRINVLGHYVSAYRNDRTGTTESRIKAWNTFDLQYTLTVDLVGSKATEINVGAINIFDRDPPVAQLNLGFDPIVHDPRGRVITVAVKQAF